jgi:hypothetical protein
VQQQRSSPAQGWQSSRLPEVIPHAQVPADLGSQCAGAEAGVSCKVSAESHDDLGGIGVEATICLTPKGTPCRTLPVLPHQDKGHSH